MTLNAALVAGINALTAAVVFLFFWFRASYKSLERTLASRDKERTKLYRRTARLEKWAGMMENCPATMCPYRDVRIPEDDQSEDEDEGEETQQIIP